MQVGPHQSCSSDPHRGQGSKSQIIGSSSSNQKAPAFLLRPFVLLPMPRQVVVLVLACRIESCLSLLVGAIDASAVLVRQLVVR